MAAEVLGNRYRLDEPIGAGGMGRVWKACDQRLDRIVAVKVIAGLNNAPEALRRLRREARTAAKLASPHIAAVYDYGHDDDTNLDYVVTEFISGEDLGSIIKKHGPQDAKDVAVWGIQVCEALTEAHTSGVYHRDLKPQNIMLTARGTIKLVDFGVAAYAEAEDYTRITATGVVVGSPAYMSPEQVEDRDVDQRSDLYSLGCTFFELLTGRPPFQGKAVSVFLDHVRTPPPKMGSVRAGVSPQWEGLVATLLKKDPVHRPGRAKVVQKHIEKVLMAPPEPTPGRAAEGKPAGRLAGNTAAPAAGRYPVQQVTVTGGAGDDGSLTGVVKWFNTKKGFGSIAPDVPGPDVFLHHSAIETTGHRTLGEGKRVRYRVVQGKRGLMAENVKAL